MSICVGFIIVFIVGVYSSYKTNKLDYDGWAALLNLACMMFLILILSSIVHWDHEEKEFFLPSEVNIRIEETYASIEAGQSKINIDRLYPYQELKEKLPTLKGVQITYYVTIWGQKTFKNYELK